jgi:hypothetical membrane protein
MMGIQPLSILAGLLTAPAVTAPYSLLSNTISDLGATTCTRIAYPFGAVPVCSPWHALVNGSFVAVGLPLVIGAPLVQGWLPAGAGAATSTVLWVVAGLSSIATGLVPIDQDPGLQALVSLPVFCAQPLALLASGWAVRHGNRTLAWSGAGVGFLSLAAGIVFLVVPSPGLSGLLERLSLWPCLLWLPLLAAAGFRGSLISGRHP